MSSVLNELGSAPSARLRVPIVLSIRGSKLTAVMLALILRALLDLSYVFIVQPLYSYAGYQLHVDWQYLYVSYLLVVAMGFSLPSSSKPSSQIAFIFYVVAYLPFTSLFSLQPGDVRYFALVNIAFFVFNFSIMLLPNFRVPPNIAHRGWILFAIGALCTLYLLVVVALRGGFSLITFDVTRIYAVRWDINDKILVGFAGYLVEWCSKVFIPALLVYGLWKRRPWFVLASVALIVLFFGITSSKGVLAYTVLVLVAYFGQQFGYFQVTFLWTAISIPITAFATFFLFGDRLVSAILLDRIYFVPTLANFQYYDFFRVHPLVYWSSSFMRAFYDFPYKEPIPLLLGRGSWQPGADAYENVGIFATGYMQLGVFGMVSFPLFAGLTLKIVDSLIANRMPVYVGFSLSVVASIQYLSGDLTETILSHGVLVLWCTLYLMGEDALTTSQSAMRLATHTTPQSLTERR